MGLGDKWGHGAGTWGGFRGQVGTRARATLGGTGLGHVGGFRGTSGDTGLGHGVGLGGQVGTQGWDIGWV